jgi:hypothetical protein
MMFSMPVRGRNFPTPLSNLLLYLANMEGELLYFEPIFLVAWDLCGSKLEILAISGHQQTY